MSRSTPAVDVAASQPLRRLLETAALGEAQVLAGADGLDRPVERLNVMEVPDILPWVKPRELLLTTAYPLRDRPDELATLVAALDDRGLSGLGVKLGRYLDELPAGMLAAAEERGFPLLRLPDDVGFDEILNEVLTSILNRQAERLARSERIHRAFLQHVLRGHGLAEIAQDLGDLLATPALIAAPDGRVLAGARLEELGLAVPPTEVDLADDGSVVRVGEASFVSAGVPISAGARVHGFVVALAPPGAEPPDDLLALENAATVCALAMTKQLELQAVEDKYRSDLMHDLLRDVDDPEDARRRASGFGWDLDRRLICIVVRMDQRPAVVVPDEVTRRPPLATAIRPKILDRDPAAAVVRFSDEVVILTGAFDGPDGREQARAFTRALAAAASSSVGGSVSVGLSRPVTEVTDIGRAYDQAGRALTIGRRVHGRGAVVHFDDLGAYRLLSLVEDVDELRSFAHEVLGELAATTSTAEDLRRTLAVLLEVGGNVAAAARQLHFHYNTLRYRIEKLEGMVGPFTTDARVRLDLQLALLVLEMKEQELTP